MGVARGGGGWRRLGRALLVLALLASVLAFGHGLAAVTGQAPMSRPGLLAAQQAWLQDEVDFGGADRMQELFPEGYFFTVVLTGLSVAATAQPGDDDAANATFDLLTKAESAQGVAPFAGVRTPPNGAFHSGWTLLLAVENARISQSTTAAEGVRRRAERLQDAFDASPTGLLESYPGQAWPCDSVVAMAALHRADRIVPLDLDPTTRRWLTQVQVLRDERGLLPHRTTPAGRVIEGPRATSQVIIQAFWPDIQPLNGPDGDATRRQWQAFVDTFVVRRAGLVAVREYPAGVAGPADVDSGPLVFGLSASATVVAIGAARAQGDLRLARDLDRGAELVGGGVTVLGQRRYAAGALPVGDAFLLWARTSPAGRAQPPVGAPRPVFAVPLALLALPGLLAGLTLLAGHRRGRRWAATSPGEPPGEPGPPPPEVVR